MNGEITGAQLPQSMRPRVTANHLTTRFDLSHQWWFMLNWFWAVGQENIGAQMAKCIALSDKCSCHQPQTINHIVESWTFTKLADDSLQHYILLMIIHSVRQP